MVLLGITFFNLLPRGRAGKLDFLTNFKNLFLFAQFYSTSADPIKKLQRKILLYAGIDQSEKLNLVSCRN